MISTLKQLDDSTITTAECTERVALLLAARGTPIRFQAQALLFEVENPRQQFFLTREGRGDRAEIWVVAVQELFTNDRKVIDSAVSRMRNAFCEKLALVNTKKTESNSSSGVGSSGLNRNR